MKCTRIAKPTAKKKLKENNAKMQKVKAEPKQQKDEKRRQKIFNQMN